MSAKVLAKADSSKKRKALLSGAAFSHIAKRTRSTMYQSSRSTTRPCLFSADSDKESEDDGDACVEILFITSIRSAAVILTDGNQSEGAAPSAAEGPNARDDWGKAIMTDAAVAPTGIVGHSRPVGAPAPSFRDVCGDAIQRDFFPFSAGPYYALIWKVGLLATMSLVEKNRMLHINLL
ncbi:hypothetical protein Tco_0929825 [Tanacetum coccineum]